MRPLRAWVQAQWIALRNARRKRRPITPYVLITLAGNLEEVLPEASPARWLRWFRFSLSERPLTVQRLAALFERIAHDPRVRGVVIKLECTASAATFQSLRAAILRLRAAGKQVIAYATTFGPFQYYAACACDRIFMPPSGQWNVLGVAGEYLFLRDALAQVGIRAEVVSVSPFKSAGDVFARADFSAESRAQAEWLLEARFAELVRGIAEGRNLDEPTVRALIDGAPLNAREALAARLIDAVAYEDELEALLEPPKAAPQAPSPAWAHALLARLGHNTPPEALPRCLMPLESAKKALLLRQRAPTLRGIGVVHIAGTIVPGNVPLPLPAFGRSIASAPAVIQALRAAEQNPLIAAIVVVVNSNGGEALASDLIAREVQRVNRRKPVVAYLSSIAASGGYYVAAPARSIITQPLTLTGSIGVLAVRFDVEAALQRLGVRRAVLKRGANADFFTSAAPLDEAHRAVIERQVAQAYADFKRIVATHRPIAEAELEAIAGGRVWTGAQAHAHKLVDALGDFTSAVEQARQLAGLPADPPLYDLHALVPTRTLLPSPAALATSLAALRRSIAWSVLPWLELPVH